MGTLNRAEKQGSESRFINHSSVLLPLTHPHPDPCLSISMVSFVKQISEDSAASYPFSLDTVASGCESH